MDRHARLGSGHVYRRHWRCDRCRRGWWVGFQMEESDTTAAADATAVADGDLIGLESALTVTVDADDNKLIGSIGYRGGKRYVRMTATGTTGTDAAVSVVATKRKGAVMGVASIDAGTAAT